MWGDENNTSTIYLNSHPIKVTRNLDSALRNLRRPDCEETLWIDALAIDQSNVQERGYQVRMMSSFYTHAATVLVYLQSETSFQTLAQVLLGTFENKKIAFEQWMQAVLEYVALCKIPIGDVSGFARRSPTLGPRRLCFIAALYWTTISFITEPRR